LIPIPRPILVALVATLSLGSAGSAAGQSLLARTPNLSGGWTGTPGTLHFNFLHRFDASDGPARKVSNFPTFLLGYTPASRWLVGVQYATNSDLVPAYPNEWEALVRFGLPAVSLTGAWNHAAESVDGEAQARLRVGRLSLLASGRAFSAGYGGDARFAVGGGAVFPFGRHLALVGDLITLLEREDGEEMAWSAGVNLVIPNTPHSLSLHATNTNTGTLQGTSRGSNVTRWGFEFTVPVTLSRYLGSGGGGTDLMATDSDTVRIAIRDFAFSPGRVTISAGTTVVWVNEGQIAHTATATDRSWDSGDMAPGASWSRRFDTIGEYDYLCTPHPFMTGTIVVVGADR
jgi:plastocyanin